MEKGFFKGGMKTDAGRERIVPIHSKIYPLVEKRYNEARLLNSDYLFNCSETKKNIRLNYVRYSSRFEKIIKTLNLNEKHKPHDPRKQFVTLAKKCKVDEYAIKYMAGHSISDITESVYTDRDEKWLKSEIEKIK